MLPCLRAFSRVAVSPCWRGVGVRSVGSSSVSLKSGPKSGHYKITLKGDRPLTYEQANPPYRIGVTKGWNSWNASTLKGGQHPAEIAVEDQFIRKFVYGTWGQTWVSEVVIKRRHNDLVVCGVVCPLPKKSNMHFLIGFAEELLSHLFKCNVRMEIQCVNSKQELVLKYI